MHVVKTCILCVVSRQEALL